MSIVKINGVDKSLYGKRMHWGDVCEKYPYHCVYYSDPVPMGIHGDSLKFCMVTVYGASEEDSSEGLEFYKELISKGIKAEVGYTQYDNGKKDKVDEELRKLKMNALLDRIAGK